MHDNWESLKNWLLKHEAINDDIQDSSKISRLDLSAKSIKSLPENFGCLDHLIALNLSNNLLKDLPESFQNLSKLSNLDIKRNKFDALPQSLRNLSIRSLNANSNTLKDISVLETFEELKVLDLSANGLTQIGSCFHKQNEMRTLNLSYNLLTNIDACYPLLGKLERFNLSGNALSEITEKIEALEEIVEIDLSDNQISIINDAFFALPLEDIDLSSNQLSTLQLTGLEDLESITLDDNSFKALHVIEDFAPYLNEFSCDGCKLSTFILPPSTELTSLCLSGNEIVTMPEEIAQYTKLAQLDIEGNQIVELPDAFGNLTRLQTLYIGNNALNDKAKKTIKILHPDICDINMKTGISIEDAKEEDLPQMAKLLSQLFAIETDFIIDYDKQLSGITKLFHYEGTHLLVARHEQKVVGMVTMQRLISSAEGDYIGQLEDLIVLDEYRKMGLGSRLINKMRFIAQEIGYKRIQLAADVDNNNALSFYSRRGLRRTHLSIYHFHIS